MKCQKCGNTIPEDSEFCQFCGERVLVSTVTKPMRRAIFPWVIIAVFIVILVVLNVWQHKQISVLKSDVEKKTVELENVITDKNALKDLYDDLQAQYDELVNDNNSNQPAQENRRSRGTLVFKEIDPVPIS